ncbi:ATP-binding protein [Flavisphingomonas formosensis]|uniref:ATP-binding protein n=1 Tax=Flavisphingomonas formosensis TaxID=861534 RepID=UPI0012F959E7|nr:ATP-binding protein [Sphingomonas formosensis]
MQPRPVPLQPARRRLRAAGKPRPALALVASDGAGPDDALVQRQRLGLLEAVEEAARIAASAAGAEREETLRTFDLGQRLRQLEPMIRALAGQRIDTAIDCAERALPVRLDPAAFDALLIELLTRRCAAMPGHGYVILRARRARGRIWLIIADSGRNPDPAHASLAHGALQTVHGRAYARSRSGHGNITAISLPAILTLSTGDG